MRFSGIVGFGFSEGLNFEETEGLRRGWKVDRRCCDCHKCGQVWRRPRNLQGGGDRAGVSIREVEEEVEFREGVLEEDLEWAREKGRRKGCGK